MKRNQHNLTQGIKQMQPEPQRQRTNEEKKGTLSWQENFIFTSKTDMIKKGWREKKQSYNMQSCTSWNEHIPHSKETSITILPS